MIMARETEFLSIHAPNALNRAVQIVRAGGLIIFPTDTLYGIAANPFDPQALHALYLAKDRPENKAIPVLLAEPSQANAFIQPPSARVKAIMDAFWPGALTLVLSKAGGLPKELSPYPTLALRVPDHPLAQELLALTGPLAVTSANLSGGENPRSGRTVYELMRGRADLVLDGGVLESGKASTIVDCSGPQPILLREGPMAFAEIQKVWGSA